MLLRLKARQHVDLLALTPKAATKLNGHSEDLLVDSAAKVLSSYWYSGGVLIVVGAVGAVTRLVAPLLGNKDDDPAENPVGRPAIGNAYKSVNHPQGQDPIGAKDLSKTFRDDQPLKHNFRGNGKILCLRIGGKIGGDPQRELSIIGKKNSERAISESMPWFNAEGRN